MKTKSVLNALKKAGLTATSTDGFKYWVQGPTHYGYFHDQNGSAVCVGTCRNGEASDARVDHFPQSYHYSIKSFIGSVSK